MSAIAKDLEELFPDARLTHLFTVVADDGLEGLKAVVAEIDATGSALVGVTVGTLGAQSLQRIHVAGLPAAAARQMANRLALHPGITRASVEHHVSQRTY